MEKLEISAEVHFAQKLASNEKKIRDRAVKRLQKYLSVRSTHGAGLSDSDLLKIWKGLFYCMWMQDKPLIQEELSQRITNLIHCFPKLRDSLNFVKVFFETNAREWNGIDRLRLDKFMMMVREMLHQTFILLSKEGWPEPECHTLARILNQHVMQYDKSQLPDGLKIHLADIFVEELNRVSLEVMTSQKMIILLRPFIFFILNSNKMELVKRIMSDVVYRAVNTFTSGGKTPPPLPHKLHKKKKRNNADVEPVQISEAGVEEKMEVEEEANNPNSFSLDRSYLILLLFRLAEKATTRAPNRALLYKLVKKYPKDRDVITKFLNYQTSANLNKEEAEVIVQNATNFQGYDLTLLEDDGKAIDKQEKNKKRRKKMKQLDREIISVNTVTSNDNLNAGDDNFGVKKKSKKNKSESTLGFSETNLINPQADVQSSEATPELSCAKSKIREKKKRVHNKIKNDSVAAVPNNENKESSQIVEKKVRKRKRVSLENDDSPKVANKKKKLSTDSCADFSAAYPYVLDESISNTSPGSESEDSNSNARSRSRSKSPPKIVSLSEAIELVTYSPKRMGTSPRSTSASPKSRSPQRLMNGSPPRSKLSTETPIMDKASAFVGDLCTALTGPCNMVKKALGMVTTNSDPGPGMKQKSHSIPGVVTPGTKKKVVFDLRRNKANKFQDYIKSLAKQPDAPYEPSKSPSVSILKSPNVSHCIDDNSDSETKSESDISELSQASKSKRGHISRKNSSGGQKK